MWLNERAVATQPCEWLHQAKLSHTALCYYLCTYLCYVCNAVLLKDLLLCSHLQVMSICTRFQQPVTVEGEQFEAGGSGCHGGQGRLGRGR